MAAGLVAMVAISARAQEPLDLPQAVAIALEQNPARKMALADTRTARAQVALVRSEFLPQASFVESAAIGNDPVYAFGALLRQGRFTQRAFDVSRLNHPAPISDFASRIEGRWNLFDSFAKVYQLRRASLMEKAATRNLDRADQELIFRVIDSYYAVGVARKQAEVAEGLVKTAQAVLESSTARVEAGSAVESDALSARVNLANRQQELIRAQSRVQIALTEFETQLGLTSIRGPEPASVLEERGLATPSLADAESSALKQRPELQALGLQVEAEQQSVKSAKAAYGPRLDVYGSWQSESASLLASGSTHWVAGAEMRVDLFSRGREARLAVEKSALARTEAARDLAANNIRLDVRRAWFAHDASRQMLEVSRASVRQAEESLRMVRDRYESGLASITDLLRAEDADRTSRVDYWQSVYSYIVSHAALELAAGALNPESPVVKP